MSPRVVIRLYFRDGAPPLENMVCASSSSGLGCGSVRRLEADHSEETLSSCLPSCNLGYVMAKL